MEKKTKTQTIRFPGVGEIQLNKERKLSLSWGQVNFDLKSFGLHFFEQENISATYNTTKKIISWKIITKKT